MKHRMHADNAITFRIWLDNKLREVYAANDLPLSEGEFSVCDYYILQSTYPINSLKVSSSADNTHLWYKKQARRRLRHLLLLSLI